MRKFLLPLSALGAIIVLGIVISSCKDDDPFVKPNLSVASATLTVAEAAGTIQVEVVLDKGAPSDITIDYDLSGTALSPADYSVVGKEGEVKIAKGQTSGIIEIQIVADAIYEGDETIIISLESVDSDDIIITNTDEVTVTIEDDEEQIQASFTASTMIVNEEDGFNDGYLEIEVTLDKPAPSDVTIKYELDGTALDSLFAFNEEISRDYYDYYINGISGETAIAGGETKGKIEIQLIPDFKYEPTDETIIITLTEGSNGVIIGETNEITISLKQQNGKVLALLWDPSYTDVDMDLLLWIGEDVANLEGVIASSAFGRTTPQEEIIFLPASLFPNAGFGLSYIYYAGTKDPMNFEVHFADFNNGVLEAEEVFTGSYGLVNINDTWDKPGGAQPVIAQTFKKVDGQILDITPDPIVIPGSGSRIATHALPKGLKKSVMNLPNMTQKFKR